MREVEQLSPEQLAGQLLVVGFHGSKLPAATASSLKHSALAGVILFARNVASVESVFELTGRIAAQAPLGFPVFIGIDQEGGRVARLRDGVLQLPPMRSLAQLNDLEFVKQVAAAQAKELVALGFNINFAPVADVDSNPANPIIGDRAFSSDPKVVVQHAKAFIAAFQAEGLMACIKHFPGHGDTHTDSHLSLPVVKRDSVSLRQVELYPFERVARGAAAAMTAHVLYPALDTVPATLSPRICTTLLRKEFGFEGVLFSDDLEMAALSANYTIEESAVRAVEAGCDALLVCSDAELIERAYQALSARAANDPDFRALCVQAVIRSVSQRRKFTARRRQSFRECSELFSQHDALRERLRRMKP